MTQMCGATAKEEQMKCGPAFAGLACLTIGCATLANKQKATSAAAAAPEPKMVSTGRADEADTETVAGIAAGDHRVVTVTTQRNGSTADAGPEALVASELVGAPTSDSAARAGRSAFAMGHAYVGRHEWDKAERWLREALQYDGSRAPYHAELGRVLLVEHRWAEAEAAFTAAVLLDLDNASYRELLKEARSQ
jgi:Flp pilus assembly protein TadD